MEAKIEIIGMNRLFARLGRAEDSLESKTVEGLSEVADRIVQDAKGIVSVDTGSLQKSIRKEDTVSQGYIHGVSVVAGGGGIINPKTGREVNYAAYVEYGTSKMQSKPFLRPALEQNRENLRHVLKSKLRESMQ